MKNGFKTSKSLINQTINNNNGQSINGEERLFTASLSTNKIKHLIISNESSARLKKEQVNKLSESSEKSLASLKRTLSNSNSNISNLNTIHSYHQKAGSECSIFQMVNFESNVFRNFYRTNEIDKI